MKSRLAYESLAGAKLLPQLFAGLYVEAMRSGHGTPREQLGTSSGGAFRPRSVGHWIVARRPSALPEGAPASKADQDVEELAEVEEGTALGRLEAVLFIAREPLPTRRLADLGGLADGNEARGLLKRLRARYEARGAAFQVEEVAGGYQLLTRQRYAPWLRRLAHMPAEFRLSGPALETLAVIAYRQPVVRADIEAVRGVQCGEILRQLMDRDLVRIVGRSEELGRPFLYGTTRYFLQMYGLRSLEELPNTEQFQASAPQETTEVEKPDAQRNDIQSIGTNED